MGGSVHRILVVEDHDETLVVMRRLLSLSGYQVLTARDAREALAAASREKCDLVVSDVGLPDQTGLQLMTQLRDLYSMKGIALSGFTSDDDVRDARQAGFAAHLSKPVVFSELISTIQKILE
jgi:CheY-like chemotaxis protein